MIVGDCLRCRAVGKNSKPRDWEWNWQNLNLNIEERQLKGCSNESSIWSREHEIKVRKYFKHTERIHFVKGITKLS